LKKRKRKRVLSPFRLVPNKVAHRAQIHKMDGPAGWGGLPVHVWATIVREVMDCRALGTLTVNKHIVAVARDVVRTIRCTVAQIPRAICVFAHARSLRVVGPDACDAAVATARAALESSARFRVFTSDDTEPNLAWLPREPHEDYTVVCECSDTKRFGDVAESLALVVGMSELVIEYFGLQDAPPNLARISNGVTRVTVQNADFNQSESCGGYRRTVPSALACGFTSTTVTELAFKGCEFGPSLPQVSGFPSLRRLEIAQCVFFGRGPYNDALRDLGEMPVPPIEYLGVEGCEGLGDVSSIARLTTLRTLVMRWCRRVDYPDFDEAASAVLKARLVSGELNAGGTGCLCKVVARRLDIHRAEREPARLARCDSECCRLCECGECSDCE
jgi:hypothetical protein